MTKQTRQSDRLAGDTATGRRRRRTRWDHRRRRRWDSGPGRSQCESEIAMTRWAATMATRRTDQLEEQGGKSSCTRGEVHGERQGTQWDRQETGHGERRSLIRFTTQAILRVVRTAHRRQDDLQEHSKRGVVVNWKRWGIHSR